MKNNIFAAASIAFAASAFSANAFADDVKIGGKVDIQYGYMDQNSIFETTIPGDMMALPYKQDGLVTDALLKADYNFDLDENNAFGVNLTFYTNTSAAPNGATSFGKIIQAYFENTTGRYEFGEMAGASIKMQKGPNNIAKGTGGIDGKFDLYENRLTIDAARKDTIFLNYPNLPVGSDFSSRRHKVSYYSPAYKGLKFGISYTRDIDDRGTLAVAQTLTTNKKPVIGKDLVSYKNIFEGGFVYSNKYKELDYSFSALGQIGDAKPVVNDVQREGLRAFGFGAEATHGNYSLAAAYGNYLDSGTSTVKIPGNLYKAYYYSVGAAYQDDVFGVSVTYFDSNRAGGSRVFDTSMGIATAVTQEDEYNKLHVFSVGTNFQIAEGLSSYMEYARFKYDRIDTTVDNSGDFYTIGLKFVF